MHANIVLKKNGQPAVLDYLPEQTEESEQMLALPYGLKLSNHLPKIQHLPQLFACHSESALSVLVVNNCFVKFLLVEIGPES